MISEEQLAEIERVANTVCFLDLRKYMLDLIVEVRRLNLIVDFVIKNSELCPPSRRNQDSCHVVEGEGWEVCPKCWREEIIEACHD